LLKTFWHRYGIYLKKTLGRLCRFRPFPIFDFLLGIRIPYPGSGPGRMAGTLASLGTAFSYSAPIALHFFGPYGKAHSTEPVYRDGTIYFGNRDQRVFSGKGNPGKRRSASMAPMAG